MSKVWAGRWNLGHATLYGSLTLFSSLLNLCPSLVLFIIIFSLISKIVKAALLSYLWIEDDVTERSELSLIAYGHLIPDRRVRNLIIWEGIIIEGKMDVFWKFRAWTVYPFSENIPRRFQSTKNKESFEEKSSEFLQPCKS